MALKKYRPLTPGLRYKLTSEFAEITTDTPEKSLIVKNPLYEIGLNDIILLKI